MGYNYDPAFLARHVELVAKLIKAATSGELLTWESDNWKAIDNRQHLVNSLLANISRNLVEYRDIRVKVRCWVRYEGDDRYRLFVGLPVHKMAGRPPGEPQVPWSESYVPLGSTAGIYNHIEVLDSEEELARFVGKVMSQGPSVKTATVKVKELTDEAVSAFFGDLFAPHGWSASRDGDTLILVRT